jgi:helicase-like protein/SNF2 domain-containing protein
MTKHLLDAHSAVATKIAKKIDPLHGMVHRPVYISHEKHGQGDRYPATMLHPTSYNFDDGLLGAPLKTEKALYALYLDDFTSEIEKAVGREECEGGRWITVHPNGDEEDGHPVKICPNPDGSHTIVGGAGGKLNGLKLLNVKSHDEYKELGIQKKAEARRQKKLAETLKRQQMGDEAYDAANVERISKQSEVEGQKKDAEKQFIAAVAKAQGIDPKKLETPAPEGTDPKIAKKLEDKNHQAALAWANKVAARVKDVVVAAYDDFAKDALGEIGMKDIASDSLGDTGKGYQAHIDALATEHGLTTGKQSGEAKGIRERRFLETSDYDLDKAKQKEISLQGRLAGRRASESEVRSVSENMAEEGEGPSTVRGLPVQPNIRNMSEAVEVLKAAKQMQSVQKQAAEVNKSLQDVQAAATLPKAALVIGKEIPEGDLMKQVAESLSDEVLRKAMTRLVTGSNELEEQSGTLQSHYSVGHTTALNTISQSVDGSTVDPLVSDILGPSATAQVIAARWRQTLDPADVDAVKSALAEQHIATQQKIADEGYERANQYLDAADSVAMPDSLPEGVEELTAALDDHAKRTEYLRRAREAIGVARGRVEASAALNDAMNQKGSKPIVVSLGAISSKDAIAQVFAIGLNKPSKYDQSGNMTQEGEYTITSDGKNRLLEIHPAGIEKLAGKPDKALQKRAAVSASIKSGEQDDPSWLPSGISRRPATNLELDPLEVRRIDPNMTIGGGDSEESISQKLKDYIGARINAGHDPFAVQADVHSASFASGLDVGQAQERDFRNALNAVAPFHKRRSSAPGGKDGTDSERAEAYKAHREEIRKRLEGYADEYVEKEKAEGRLSDEEASLENQRVPLDETARDSLYQAALADPRTRYAYTAAGDLDHSARDSIRSYAFEKLFGIDRKASRDDVITPLTSQERAGYDAWSQFKDQHSDPYTAIQKHMAEGGEEDLFGEKTPSPFATVDLTNDADLIKVGQQNPAALGYKPLVVGTDGSLEYPELQAGKSWTEVGESGKPVEFSPRTEETVASDVRRRIRGVLRHHFLSEIAGQPDLADSGFNPDSVETASDRWTQYVRDMGGEKRAIKSVQEFMAGDLVSRFASVYGQRTGKKMTAVARPIQYAQAHAEAMLPPEKRGASERADRSTQARLQKNRSGRFGSGSVKEKVESAQQEEQEGSKLFGDTEKGGHNVNVHRASIGRAAEKALAGMMPHVNTDRPVEAAGNVTMSGKGINRQRAVKLITENKRQGLCLSAGVGKTLCGIGSFTELRNRGEASKALYVVPSNIVGQFGGEFYKFVDPESGLRWHADPGASADERKAAYADKGTHAVVVTPEALREDVTRAIAEENGWSPQETVEKMSAMKEKQVDELVHGVMDKRGWNFDFMMGDESHRLLSRTGKPDSHMQRIGDSVSRKTPNYVFSSADPIKNDSSEIHSVLSKIAPNKYNESNRDAFNRKYGRNTLASATALQREMEPYIYTASVDMGVDHNRSTHLLPMEPGQQKEHDAILDAYKRARSAKMQGKADVEALKVLSPKAFESGESQTVVASRLNRSLGIQRDTALNRAVNLHPDGAKSKWVLQYMSEHNGEPTVIFAHNLDAAGHIAESLKAAGHRVGVLTGGMSSDAKDKAKNAFSPSSGEASTDILVSTDAGCMGANLQRGYHMINIDTPQTATVHEQRIAREVRTGQQNAVSVHDLVADSPFDLKARQRLENKSKLRELTTTPTEKIDDDGLAYRIEAARAKAFEGKYKGKAA